MMRLDPLSPGAAILESMTPQQAYDACCAKFRTGVLDIEMRADLMQIPTGFGTPVEHVSRGTYWMFNLFGGLIFYIPASIVRFDHARAVKGRAAKAQAREERWERLELRRLAKKVRRLARQQELRTM